jgi:hypothetical protein
MGPISRIKEKLETRWGQPEWPITWVKRQIHECGLEGEKLPLPPTENQEAVRKGNAVSVRTSTTVHIKA